MGGNILAPQGLADKQRTRPGRPPCDVQLNSACCETIADSKIKAEQVSAACSGEMRPRKATREKRSVAGYVPLSFAHPPPIFL